MVNEGDGLFHVAKIRSGEDTGATIESLLTQLDAETLFDEDQIIQTAATAARSACRARNAVSNGRFGA